MHFRAAHSLAAILLNLATHSQAPGAADQALAFTSARTGVSLFEPRIEFPAPRRAIRAGDVLEYDILVPQRCARQVGVELVFFDGRRTVAPEVVTVGAWYRTRISLDEFVGAGIVRSELIARGNLTDEIGFRVDEIVITNTASESFVLFHDTLTAGPRHLRDEARDTGLALVERDAPFAGIRTVLDGTPITEPWHAYDLANLRRLGDGSAVDALAPRGNVLIGPGVPMKFAEAGERTSVVAEGQRFSFEPLEGGRFYTLWLALATTDGAPLATRMYAFGDAGERQQLSLLVPAADDDEDRTTKLGGCRLLELAVAAPFPMRGIQLPEDTRLRVHAISFQWRKDGAGDAQFQASWLRQLASSPGTLLPKFAAELRRFVDNRNVSPIFALKAGDDEIVRTIFNALLRNDIPAAGSALDEEMKRLRALSGAFTGLSIALETVGDNRGSVRIESGMDPETMLREFATQSAAGALVLDGDPAVMRAVPQIMSGLGHGAAVLESGPPFARWSAPDGSGVLVFAPYAVLRDTREFAEMPWRQWMRNAKTGQESPAILIAVEDSSRDAAGVIARALDSIVLAPRVLATTGEDFLNEAFEQFGAETPEFAPGPMQPVRDDRRRDIALRAPALRRATIAIGELATLATPAGLDGSAYPTAEIESLRRSLGDGSRGSSTAVLGEIATRAEGLLAAELAIIARSATTAGKGTPIVAFNSMPWPRRGLVRLDSQSAILLASDGTRLPWQATGDGGRIFVLEVPALGYHVTHGLQGEDKPTASAAAQVSVNGWTARNEDVAFTIDPATGAMTSLQGRADGDELLLEPAQFVGEGWAVEHAEFLERGPLRAVAAVTMARAGRRAELQFVLEARVPYVELRASVDGDPASDPIAWRVAGKHVTARTLFGVPFGFTLAGPLPDGAPARHRIGDWAASTDGTTGIGILSGDLTTLLVEPAAVALEFSAPTTRCALMPFSGGWRRAAPATRAAEFATPIRLVTSEVHEGARPARHSFAKLGRRVTFDRLVDGAECGVVMTTFEPTNEGAGVIIRLAETNGASSALALWFDRPVFGAERIDLRGTPTGKLRVEDNRVELRMEPHRITTIRVRMRP